MFVIPGKDDWNDDWLQPAAFSPCQHKILVLRSQDVNTGKMANLKCQYGQGHNIYHMVIVT